MTFLQNVWPWNRLAELRHDRDAARMQAFERLVALNAANYRIRALMTEQDQTKEALASFDHDGDGKPGGSKPKGER